MRAAASRCITKFHAPHLCTCIACNSAGCEAASQVGNAADFEGLTHAARQSEQACGIAGARTRKFQWIANSGMQCDFRHDVQVLNRILEHMDFQDAKPFTSQLLADVSGYNGEYTIELTRADSDAVRSLRQATDKSLHDLDKMLTVLGMDELYPGLPTEI